MLNNWKVLCKGMTWWSSNLPYLILVCQEFSCLGDFHSFPPLCLQALPAEDCTALLALGAGTPVAALDLVGSSEEAAKQKEGHGVW